ncbi:hypothetical protein ACJMK2_042558 [Sinanodonta woodiana]|uniref:C-type lectin domain-containing protein n=1 Tax=Sinanodonta woodiana TaxID=1069815 RepID=A0ABD3WB25_SINWO
MHRTTLVFISLCLKPWTWEYAAANILKDEAKGGINVQQRQEDESWLLVRKDLEILMLKTERLERQMAEVLQNIPKVTGSGRLTGANQCQCQCPSNYTWHWPLNLCFRLSKEKQTWETASQICESEGGHLAKVNTTQIQQYLKEQIQNSRYLPKLSHAFVGGNDKEEEGIWRWADRELIDMDSPVWIPTEPNSGTSENCLVLWAYGDYHVGDFDCSARLYYICQI